MKRYGLMVTCALMTAAILGWMFYACGDESFMKGSDGGYYDAGGGYDAGNQNQCQTDQDCGPGLSCRNGKCVSIPDAGGGVDAGPPEDEHMEFQPPVGSENYVFVVNTTLGTVAKIDPGALSNIEVSSIPVGTRPTILYTIPGSDTAVVLNEGSKSISVIVASPGQDVVHVPSKHSSPSAQRAAHEPQLSGSRIRSAHAPEHRVRPARQEFTHVPASQIWPDRHSAPHAPQFR